MHPLPFSYMRNLQCEDCDLADDMFETGNAFAVSFTLFYEGCPKCSDKLDVKVINLLITGLNRTIQLMLLILHTNLPRMLRKFGKPGINAV